jgi:hypothetical protein
MNIHRLKKTALRFWLAYTFVLALMLLLPSSIHRQGFDQAFMNWYKNPTPNNYEVLNKERSRNSFISISA